MNNKGEYNLKKTVLTVSTAAIVTFGSTFAINSPSVYAQPSLDEVNEQQSDIKDKLSDAESKVADILFEIKDINEEIEELEAKIKEDNDEIEKSDKELDSYQNDIDDIIEKIDSRNEILKERISSYQDSGGDIGYLEVFLGSKDFNEFISRLSAVTSISNADAELIEKNEQDKEKVEEKIEEQKELKEEQEERKEKNVELQDKQKESKKALKEKQKEAEKEKANLESESSELNSLEDEILSDIEEQEEQEEQEEAASNDETNETAGSNEANDVEVASETVENDSGSKTEKKSKDTNVPYSGTGGSAISAGKQFIGNSTYNLGAKSPSTGEFDCSGFVQWAYEQEGVSLPRTAGAMANSGQKVSYSEAKPGDLVLFRGGSHVGIYLGNGQFLGSQTSTGVAVANMNSGYWAQHFDNNVRRIK